MLILTRSEIIGLVACGFGDAEDPNVMLGKPAIRGTRFTVELLLRKLAEGATEADLIDAYPHLTREDIRLRSPTQPTPSRTKKRMTG